MACVEWFLGCLLLLPFAWVAGKLFGTKTTPAFWEESLGRWWDKKFPPSEPKRKRGFEVKLNTGETPVPLKKKDDDHG